VSYEIGYSGKNPYLKVRYTQFWREIQAALRSGQLHRWYDLTPQTRALIVAAVEQQNLIDQKAIEVGNMPTLGG
jgi:hypothetical protein